MQAPTQQQQYESNIVQILSMQRNQAQDALVDAQAREAYTETVREAGNRYSLRLDQLAWFVATAGA